MNFLKDISTGLILKQRREAKVAAAEIKLWLDELRLAGYDVTYGEGLRAHLVPSTVAEFRVSSRLGPGTGWLYFCNGRWNFNGVVGSLEECMEWAREWLDIDD